MSSMTLALNDSRTMLRRQMVHVRRYPEMYALVLGLPIILLLVFVYVLGGTLGAGLTPGAARSGGEGRAAYANYVVPGIVLITLATIAQGVAIKVAMDMTQGIVARFRTLPIARGAVLTGHAVAGAIQAVGSVVVVLLVALLVGFRPSTGVIGWLAVAGLVALVGLAVSWLSVALGLSARTVETASNTPMFLTLLPFLGSGFVPTDSMPTVLRWFAQYQPFTPVMDTMRALFSGDTVSAGTAWLGVGWWVVILVASWAWARRLYARPAR